jgi:hypothetical protein
VGVQVVRVPPDFKHPANQDGDLVPGAHLEPLYHLDDALKTGYQLYENVSEGTPQSPIFGALPELRGWLVSEGWDEERIAFLIEHGHAPSFVARS